MQSVMHMLPNVCLIIHRVYYYLGKPMETGIPRKCQTSR
jgi:hypothetical protein